MSGSPGNTLAVNLRAQRGSFNLNADFSVSTEGITAVCGKSGAGKSTLLRAIAGLEPARGLIRVGSSVWQDEHRSVPVHERRLGYVFQRATLFEHLNVRRNLEYGMRRRNVSRGTFEQTVQLLTLEKLLPRPAHELSGGEQQRVAIGRALLSNPRLLLMDEPLSSLDAEHKLELLGYLEMLQTELQIPVLYVSHSPEEIARLADQLILLDEGNTLGCGSAAEMLTRLDLPLSLSEDAAALLTARCVNYEPEYNLSRLSLGSELQGETLYAPGDLTSYGDQTLRLRVLARDVSLTIERQTDTSILNIVPVRVLETITDGHAQCHIRLDCGGQMLLSKITQKSASQLQIRQGQLLYAQIKSVALL